MQAQQAVFSRQGWLVAIRQGSLFAHRLDLTAETLSGNPVFLSEGVNFGNTAPALSTSGTGLLAYRTTGARQLTWVDRAGKILGTVGQVDETIGAPALSHDGLRVAVEVVARGNSDISIIDKSETARLTSDQAPDRFPLWSPDGTRIVHARYRAGRSAEYLRPAAGSGTEELLAEAVPPVIFNGPTDWSRDGRFLLVDVNDPKPVGAARRLGASARNP